MAELPEYIEEVRVLRPEPTDVMVLTISSPYREAQVQAAEWAEALFPHHRVVILGPDEDLKVVREYEGPASPSVS